MKTITIKIESTSMMNDSFPFDITMQITQENREPLRAVMNRLLEVLDKELSFEQNTTKDEQISKKLNKTTKTETLGRPQEEDSNINKLRNFWREAESGEYDYKRMEQLSGIKYDQLRRLLHEILKEPEFSNIKRKDSSKPSVYVKLDKEEKVPSALPPKEEIDMTEDGLFDEAGNVKVPEGSPNISTNNDWDEPDDEEDDITKKIEKYEKPEEKDKPVDMRAYRKKSSYRKGEGISNNGLIIREYAKKSKKGAKVTTKEIMAKTGLRYNDVMNGQQILLKNGFTKKKEGNRIYFVKDGVSADNTDKPINEVTVSETVGKKDKKERLPPLIYESVKRLKNIIKYSAVGTEFNKSKFCYDEGIILDSKCLDYMAVCDYINVLVKAGVLKKLTSTKYKRQYDIDYFKESKK